MYILTTLKWFNWLIESTIKVNRKNLLFFSNIFRTPWSQKKPSGLWHHFEEQWYQMLPDKWFVKWSDSSTYLLLMFSCCRQVWNETNEAFFKTEQELCRYIILLTSQSSHSSQERSQKTIGKCKYRELF